MPTPADTVLRLRQLLSERFGDRSFDACECFPTGLPALDEVGLPRAAISEIVSSSAEGPGGSLLLYGLLHSILEAAGKAVLVDGGSAFAPKALSQAELDRLLWVRCRDGREVTKSADLVVRDGNISLVVLLLTTLSPREMRGITASAWQRLQMLAEKSTVTVVAFTSRAQIGCARLRISVGAAFPLEKLNFTRGALLSELEIKVERQRWRRRGDEELCRAACA